MWKRIALLWTLVRGDARQLWFALRHPAAPGWLKLGTAMIALYLLSPIDLIPDALPLIGVVDDLVLVPLASAGCSDTFRLTSRGRGGTSRRLTWSAAPDSDRPWTPRGADRLGSDAERLKAKKPAIFWIAGFSCALRPIW